MHESDSDEMSFRGLAPDDRNGLGAPEAAPSAPRTDQPGTLARRLDGASAPVEPEAPLPSGQVEPSVPPGPIQAGSTPGDETVQIELGKAPASAEGAAAPKNPRVTVEITGEGHPGSSLSPRHQLQEWLGQMVQNRASDLILRSGGRPSQRLDGRISFLPGKVPGPGPMLEVLRLLFYVY